VDGSTNEAPTATSGNSFNRGWEGGILHVWYTVFGFNDEPPHTAGAVVDEMKRRWKESCGNTSSSVSWEVYPGGESITFPSGASVRVDPGTTEEET